MSAYLFPLYVLCHFATLCSAIYLGRAFRAPGAAWVGMIAAALLYDNLIVSLGTTIGIGDLLQTLSWPRFAMHALLTPFLMIAATRLAIAGGVKWAGTRAWMIAVWILVIAMMTVGAFEGLIGLETYPACFDGIVRYTANLDPSHFCFEGEEAVKGGGPPIPAIVGNIVTLAVGFCLWRQNGWVWMLLGAIVMFGAAAVPFSRYGMAPSNAGEVVLMFSYIATVARFRRR